MCLTFKSGQSQILLLPLWSQVYVQADMSQPWTSIEWGADLSNGSLVEFSKATWMVPLLLHLITKTSPRAQFQWPSGSLPVLVTYQSYYFSVISNSYCSFGISDSLNLLLIGNSWLIKIITTFVDKVNSTFNSFFT